MKFQRSLVFVTVLGFLACAMGSAEPGKDSVEKPWSISWSKVEYKARKLGLSMATTITCELVDRSRAAERGMLPFRAGSLRPRGSQLVLLSFADRVLGRRSDTRLWLEPADGRILQRIKVYRGSKGRYKAYVFGDEGLHLIRRKPEKGQASTAVSRWPVSSDSYLAFPDFVQPGTRLSVAAGLFYQVALGGLRKVGDSLTVPIYTSDGLMQVQLQAQGTAALGVSYLQRTERSEEMVTGSRYVLRVTVDGEPLDPELAEASFELLGLEEDVELLLDPELAVVLAVRGKAPVVGKVTVKLTGLTLR
jgi:hypothetical protein